jgi:protein-serine/threonine kinase
VGGHIKIMSQAAVQQQSTPQHAFDSYDGVSGRDRYIGNQASSSPPTRRATRPSEGGNASLPNTPQQPSFSSPTGSAAMSTPRGPAAPPASGGDALANSTYEQYYPDQPGYQSNMPIRSAPQQQQQVSPADASAHDSPRYSSSRGQGQPSTGYASESDRAATSDSEYRRQQQQRSPREQNPPQPGSGRSQRTRQAPSASRSQNAMGQTPVDTSLPRENSAIINRIVVDDPGSDIGRERQRIAEARPQHAGDAIPPMVPGAGMSGELPAAEAAPVPQQRSRQEHLKHSSHRKEVKFGDYILGSTLGEGEFGKVKMGWKKESTVQVAIKLIRKESLAGNATRLPKIYREISILKGLQHPNIVKLHEFIETERHMGIVLEYASGGELFDYILTHRYLKDPAARRLFAQLVSGVGYLHKKGIVHRDLKLENLLLDRNKNIIITDFGFANTFDPHDELGEEVERRIQDKEFVKRERLNDQDPLTHHRRGDLMQTSCGSPCYAAPELVVSDGLYTGRKVDVWSCGVILVRHYHQTLGRDTLTLTVVRHARRIPSLR